MADPANVKLWWPLGSEDTVCKMLAKKKGCLQPHSSGICQILDGNKQADRKSSHVVLE